VLLGERLQVRGELARIEQLDVFLGRIGRKHG
jgi:hypothetical protein